VAIEQRSVVSGQRSSHASHHSMSRQMSSIDLAVGVKLHLLATVHKESVKGCFVNERLRLAKMALL
jgi:hypothetical protein